MLVFGEQPCWTVDADHTVADDRHPLVGDFARCDRVPAFVERRVLAGLLDADFDDGWHVPYPAVGVGPLDVEAGFDGFGATHCRAPIVRSASEATAATISAA